MKQSNHLFVFTESPYQSARVREGLDALMIGASFGVQLSVLFAHNGVFNLLSQQQASAHGLKPFTKAFGALTDFEIDNIYLDQASASARGIEESQLMIEAQMLSIEEIKSLMMKQNRIITF